MSGADFTISGTENLKKIFKDLPEYGYRQPVNTAFRKAAKPVAGAMVQNLPATLSGLKKSIRVVTYKGGEPMVAVGVFKKGMVYQNKRGQNWNPYMLMYWFNYGTLANRSSEHSFKNPRSKKSASFKGGIKPGLFIERAIESSMPGAQKIFEEEFDKEMIKFFEKRAAQ